MSINSICSSRLSFDSSKRMNLNKITFSDYQLSYQVRKRVYELLITFSDNQNYQFEKEEIHKALVTLLKENQHELSYVTKNVFRYDKNQDGIITYQQFTNFCLEQHFGEMAIQRLHKKNFYAQGKKRMMDKDQFIKTLLYCFSFIDFKCELAQLRQIFDDIDSTNQGFIHYTDYFYFLKEYFGSQSQSVEVVQIQNVFEQMKKNKKFAKKLQQLEKQAKKSTKSVAEEKHSSPQYERKRVTETLRTNHDYQNIISSRTSIKSNKNAIQPTLSPQMKDQISEQKKLCQRIARLVYHQLKVTAMNYDEKKLLKLNEISAKELMNKHFKIPLSDSTPILQHLSLKNTNDTTSYESLLQEIVQTFMCKILPEKKQIRFPLSKQEFIQITKSHMLFINAKPHTYMLEEIFSIVVVPALKMQKQQFITLMQKIFKSYEWPRRTGEPRKML